MNTLNDELEPKLLMCDSCGPIVLVESIADHVAQCGAMVYDPLYTRIQDCE